MRKVEVQWLEDASEGLNGGTFGDPFKAGLDDFPQRSHDTFSFTIDKRPD